MTRKESHDQQKCSIERISLGFRCPLSCMEIELERALEYVAATLIDARSKLEDIDSPVYELNELHGEITRAHALCWQIIMQVKKAESHEAEHARAASA